jgi:ZIP family zinc transporter
VNAVIFSAVAFFSTLLGGLAAARFRRSFGILAAFVAGVLIAVPLFDLLPEALTLGAESNIPPQNVMYVVAVGFLFLLTLSRYICVHRICEGDECRNVRHPHAGWFGASELSIHSFMDGFAIGLGFQADAHAGLVVAMAVIAHDFSDGMNTVTIMLKAGNSLRSSLQMLIVDAAAPVLGAISTLFIAAPPSVLVYLLPFFAGGFLYLGASDLLPEAHEKNPPLVSLLSTLAGFLVIFAVMQVL